MHRPSTHAEKIAKLGAAIVGKYRVIDHDPASVVNIGEIDGIPLEVNPEIIAPGTFLAMTGVVEPHQYAGYSGGAKTAVIGCGGATTIGMTHGPRLLDRDGVRLGSIDGNPFQDFVRRAGEIVGVDVIANAVLPEPDHLVAAAVGPVTIHDDLVKTARAIYETPVPNALYDVVIAGVGAPKDANLYQASRAATYIGLSGAPVIRPGGVVIVPATMPEGAGEGKGEQNFYEILQEKGAGAALIRHLRAVGCRPGEQRAYMMAQLLEKVHCIFVGANDPGVVTGANLMHAPDMASALAQAADLCGSQSPKTLVVPHALKCIPTPG
jgi:nickel-dependent lactate racemase